MQKTAVLINTARGSVVDEEAAIGVAQILAGRTPSNIVSLP
jgi:lactate dehydrogenase-like 2-hydroxyacid dehydrogenase